MSNAVERMMEEYGVEKIRNCKTCKYSDELCCDTLLYCKKTEYPPFTAEKQIELIKLIQNDDKINCLYVYKRKLESGQEKYALEAAFHMKYDSDKTFIIQALNDNWRDALAELIIQLQPYLDNAKVKEILER